MEYVTLNNGLKMPQLGYGVYLIEPDECVRCVKDALSVGYRAIDTAQIYANEKEVGQGIKESGIPREDIFLTTKVWIDRYSYDETKKSVEESLEKLGTDYLDLCLLHQPFNDCYSAYRALEDLYDEGVLKAIGVSNFYPDRLVDLSCFTRIKPMVNQIEMHPLHQRKTDVEWMEKMDIQPEAWAPMGHGSGNLAESGILKTLAEKYGKTAMQIVLRWHIQRGVVVIPKSTKKERMEENINVFDFALTAEEMEKIATLDTGKSLFFSHQDPAATLRYAERVGRHF